MAKVYYPKKTSTKLMEGVVAGLLAAVVYTVVMLLADLITPDRSWWTSASVLGGIFTGVSNFNTASPDMGSLILGLIITFVVFALLGLGIVNYIPIFRRFNLPPLLGGGLYGLLIWVVVDLIVVNPLTQQRLNLIALLVADLLAGATMAWWVARQPVQEPPEAPEAVSS